MNVILIGFKGVGKTYWGKKLAQKLNISHIDTDQLIMDHYENETSNRLTIAQICEKIGEKCFRVLESQILKTLPKSLSVVSTGGGVILDPQNIKYLKGIGQIIYLKQSKAKIYNHLKKGPVPSFLKSDPFELSFERMYQKRAPLYESFADDVLDLNQVNQEQVIDLLCDILKKGSFYLTNS